MRTNLDKIEADLHQCDNTCAHLGGYENVQKYQTFAFRTSNDINQLVNI